VPPFAAFDHCDVALVDKRVSRCDRRVEAAARIVAEIDDEADQLVAGLLPHVVDRVGKRLRGLIVETGDADITDVAAFEAAGDGRQFDISALDLDLDRGAGTAAQHQGHFAIRRTAQLLLDLRQGQVVGRFFVDREDDVAGLYVRRCRG
jgi:hypothetical protein